MGESLASLVTTDKHSISWNIRGECWGPSLVVKGTGTRSLGGTKISFVTLKDRLAGVGCEMGDGLAEDGGGSAQVSLHG